MRSLLIVALMCVATYTVVCQSTAPKYQVGTTTEVTRHDAAPGAESSISPYEGW
jgi:hypothetical protein